MRSNTGVGKTLTTGVLVQNSQLEAIIRISESLAKMTLTPVVTEQHVNEAIRLFDHSTMEAVQSGMSEYRLGAIFWRRSLFAESRRFVNS